MTPATTFNQIVGQVVLHHRKKTDLTQAHVAEALGLSQSAYSRLERGEIAFTLPQFRTVADTLNVPLVDLLSHAEKGEKILEAQDVKVIVRRNCDGMGSGLLWLANQVLASAITTAVVQDEKSWSKKPNRSRRATKSS